MRFFPKHIGVPALALLTWSCSAVPSPEQAQAPRRLEDPLEPLNRFTWQFNRALTLGIMDPLSSVYVAVVPEPVRKSVGRVRNNLGEPSRVLNQALQGRWKDSGQESLRFVTNTTLGVGGLFDVAGHLNLPGKKADFNQTFRHWGMRPSTYLVLPALGPSDEVHTPGSLMEIAADPSNYIPELAVVGHVTRFHRVTEMARPAAAIFRSEPDSYSLVREAWPYLSRATSPDWTPKGPPDPATLQTLSAVVAHLQDPLFANRAKKGFARIPHTKRKLPYSLWLQNHPAPLVFLSPGVGSHRLSANSLTVAEAFYRQGCSVAAISGVFHPEFMESSSNAPMPGNPLHDRADLLAAFTAIDASISREFSALVQSRVLAGFSLGGFMTLQLAATEKTHPSGSVRFDRYVAIQSPIDLRHAYQILDDFADTPSRWPTAQRDARIDNTFHKAVAMLNGVPCTGVPPFDAQESRFLVGYAFRRVLRDAIFSLQRNGKCGGLDHRTSMWRREEAYRKLMEIRFDEYYHNWLLPAEKRLGTSNGLMARATDLKSLESALRHQNHVRLIENRNDFLVSEDDKRWVDRTFGCRAVWLPGGGHLGNLDDPALHEAIARALDLGK